MDPNLTFGNHVLETVSWCMSRLAQINRVKYSFDRQPLIIIINSLVFSKLFYCSCIWSNTSQTNLKMLQTVQNFACCIVSGSRKYDHVSPAFKELRWMPVKEHLYYLDAVMSLKYPIYIDRTHTPIEIWKSGGHLQMMKCRTINT